MELFEAFETQVDAWLSRSSAVPAVWKRERNWRLLELAPDSDDGFKINANAGPEYVFVILDGLLLVEFQLSELEPLVDTAEKAAAFVRLCCSPSARLRQKLASGSPYESVLEVWHGGQWIPTRSGRSWLYNWFGSKSERTVQNRWIGPEQSRAGL